MSIDVLQTTPRSQYGFTLIEIMVVVVILGILAALVAPNVIKKVDDAQIVKAKSDIRAIDSSLKMFRLENFKYPTTDQGLEALVTRPADPSIKNWSEGGYLDRLLNDPWGNQYRYLQPGTQGGVYDIFTLGADAQPGGEGINADIGNWNLE